MTWENYDDVISQLNCAGLIIDKQLLFDAKIHRWKVDGEDREKRGWTKLREWTSKAGRTYIVGAFGIWNGNNDGYCKLTMDSDKTSALTEEDWRAIKAAHKEAERKLAEVRRSEIKRASQWAASVWGKCAPCDSHEVLTTKQIKSNGLRVMSDSLGDITLSGIDESNFYRLKVAAGALVVPMHDAKGALAGLQFIYAKGHPRLSKIKGNKENWPSGMAMGGMFGLIGPIRREGIVLIAEGYATAASLHEATGQTVAYTFSANNLLKAAKQLAKEYPLIRLLFCADDDYLTEGNPGCTAAANATAEIERSAWIKPRFPLDEAGNDLRAGKKLTDFNDLHVMTGLLITLADQVNAKLDELKWRDVKKIAATQEQGGGERIALKSVLTIDEAVERFALVFGGKGTMFDHQEHILVPKTDVLDIIPEHGWRDMRSIKKVVRLTEVGFDPACTDKRILCNLFGGWPTMPKKGRCDLLLELLDYLCSEEIKHNEVYDWVLKWIAYPIQHPGAKMKTALVFHGRQGTGKNLFFESVMEIYGEYGRVIDQDALEDKFNDWASRKLYMIADEVVARAELYHAKNKLKGIITGTNIRINPKNVSAHDEVNHVNLVFLANEYMPLVIDPDDRRYTVIHTPEKLSKEFYEQVVGEINAGGIAALHYYLLNLDLGDFSEHSKPPMTQAKKDLIEVSLDSVQRFVQEWHQGEIKHATFMPCLGSHLYITYKRWCEFSGERSPRSQSQFIGTIRNMSGWRAGQPIKGYENLNSTVIVNRKIIIPSDEMLSTTPITISKEGKTQTSWVTECFFRFAMAGEFEC